MKTETRAHANWAREFKQMLSRRWKEKLLALLLAYFFWNIVRERIQPTFKKQQDFIEQHGLKEQSGL